MGSVKPIITLFFFLASLVVSGQDTSPEHLDTIVNNFVNDLKANGVDTICVYQGFFVGGRSSITGEEDECIARYYNVPTFILWVKDGDGYLSEKDNCFDYSTVQINEDSIWRYLFSNYDSIKIEKIEECLFFSSLVFQDPFASLLPHHYI